jgi:hypothetical protein
MFPKQKCPVCQNRAWMGTVSGAMILDLHQVKESKARLMEENEKLVKEIEDLKERLAQGNQDIDEPLDKFRSVP